MALFVLGDPHLSLGASKPMDIFPGWNDYVDRLEKNWRKLITPQDTIVLAGDISWAMRLTDTRKDFAFLQQLPGQKIIMKGNHDYWWSTANKMNAYLKAEGFDTLHILHNAAPASLAALRSKPERFDTVIAPAQIAEVALGYQA